MGKLALLRNGQTPQEAAKLEQPRHSETTFHGGKQSTETTRGETAMGTVKVTIGVGDPQGRQFEELDVTVDTGSTYTEVNHGKEPK